MHFVTPLLLDCTKADKLLFRAEASDSSCILGLIIDPNPELFSFACDNSLFLALVWITLLFESSKFADLLAIWFRLKLEPVLTLVSWFRIGLVELTPTGEGRIGLFGRMPVRVGDLLFGLECADVGLGWLSIIALIELLSMLGSSSSSFDDMELMLALLLTLTTSQQELLQQLELSSSFMTMSSLLWSASSFFDSLSIVSRLE